MGAESPKEECGLFGVWAPGEDVARLTFFGLFALQHRGQESAGMAVSDGTSILVYRELGLVSQVFNEPTLSTLQGDLCIGHTRYSTTGSTTWENAQPVFKTDGTNSLALGHNGNLVNTAELAERGGRPGAATTDSDLVTRLIADEMLRADGLEAAALRVLPHAAGRLLLRAHGRADRVRGPRRARRPPASIGRLADGLVVASETCALDIVGATFVREVEPGELVRIDDRGLHCVRFAESPRRRSACSSSSTSRAPDSRHPWTERSTSRAGRWAAASPRRVRWRPTSSSRFPTTGHSAAQGFAR